MVKFKGLYLVLQLGQAIFDGICAGHNHERACHWRDGGQKKRTLVKVSTSDQPFLNESETDQLCDRAWKVRYN
jgi:hypothetical protein